MIMQAYGDIILNDGLSKFGVASEASRDEIFIAKYKIVYIFSKSIEKYVPLLRKYGLEEKEKLVTAWETFSKQTPGICRSVNINGNDIYNVRDKLAEHGMYKGQIREEGT
jgi:enolase